MPPEARGQSVAARAVLRALPSVDALLGGLEGHESAARGAASALVEVVREVLAAERRRVLEAAGGATVADAAALGGRVVARLSERGAFSLAPVVNATGVVLHTNLGRALLSPLAQARLLGVAGVYSNLEMDLARKERGSRYVHVQGLLGRLTGAPASLVVNNNAAAVLLALESLARGKEVIVSRGELIEIGGEFRIPDIMGRSGAVLREVGTTNRTHLRDYAGAIGPDTALILKVHTSNYRVVGFTADVSSRELAELGRARGLCRSWKTSARGASWTSTRHGFPHEPTVPDVVASGVDLVSFSGDKLLGGPQAGIVVGRSRPDRASRPEPAQSRAPHRQVHRRGARGNAVRLRGRRRPRDHSDPPDADRAAAEHPAAGAGTPPPSAREDAGALGAHVAATHSQVGGGALPTVELPTAALALGTPTLDRPRAGRGAPLRGSRRCSAVSWTIVSCSTAAPFSRTTCRRSRDG